LKMVTKLISRALWWNIVLAKQKAAG